MIGTMFKKTCRGIAVSMAMFLSFFSVAHAQTLAPINSAVPVSNTLNSSSINTYWDYCVNDGDSNDTFE